MSRREIPPAASRRPASTDGSDTIAALTDLDPPGVVERVLAAGGQAFQARQIEHWLYAHGATTFEQCRNVPARLKAAMASGPPLVGSTVVHEVPAADGTRKLLLRLHDGEHIESVLIPEGDRMTLCVSTQVGCPVACVFCASGLDGVRRNLRRGEIVEQVLHARAALGSTRITNVVVMGMGEPMLNLDNLIPALDRLRDEDGIGLGARRITVSTSGYPDRIRRLAQVDAAYGLAVSLHAADDELRRRLVPTARVGVAELVAAAVDFGAAHGREVTFEVVLLADVNDRRVDAEALVARLRGVACTVNLIPWNPVAAISGLARPTDDAVDRFADHLRAAGLNVTVRRQRGADEAAACGQLRLVHQQRQ